MGGIAGSIGGTGIVAVESVEVGARKIVHRAKAKEASRDLERDVGVVHNEEIENRRERYGGVHGGDGITAGRTGFGA